MKFVAAKNDSHYNAPHVFDSWLARKIDTPCKKLVLLVLLQNQATKASFIEYERD